jgi:hypothetical protein
VSGLALTSCFAFANFFSFPLLPFWLLSGAVLRRADWNIRCATQQTSKRDDLTESNCAIHFVLLGGSRLPRQTDCFFSLAFLFYVVALFAL